MKKIILDKYNVKLTIKPDINHIPYTFIEEKVGRPTPMFLWEKLDEITDKIIEAINPKKPVLKKVPFPAVYLLFSPKNPYEKIPIIPKLKIITFKENEDIPFTSLEMKFKIIHYESVGYRLPSKKVLKCLTDNGREVVISLSKIRNELLSDKEIGKLGVDVYEVLRIARYDYDNYYKYV